LSFHSYYRPDGCAFQLDNKQPNHSAGTCEQPSPAQTWERGGEESRLCNDVMMLDRPLESHLDHSPYMGGRRKSWWAKLACKVPQIQSACLAALFDTLPEMANAPTSPLSAQVNILLSVLQLTNIPEIGCPGYSRRKQRLSWACGSSTRTSSTSTTPAVSPSSGAGVCDGKAKCAQTGPWPFQSSEISALCRRPIP
jgi:hypothetical protein